MKGALGSEFEGCGSTGVREVHEPLSQALGRLIGDSDSGAELSLNKLLARTGGRGVYLLIILLCLPFVTPITLPGMSGLFGLVILMLTVRIGMGLEPRLPRFVGERQISGRILKRVIGASVRLLGYLEVWVKPRRSDWLGWRSIRMLNGFVLSAMSVILSLPVPFGNVFPTYAIIFIAASLMEEDGRMIWFGYFWVLVTVVYCWLLATGGVLVVKRLFGWGA